MRRDQWEEFSLLTFFESLWKREEKLWMGFGLGYWRRHGVLHLGRKFSHRANFSMSGASRGHYGSEYSSGAVPDMVQQFVIYLYRHIRYVESL